MTPLRQAFHAALVTAGLCVAAPTFAEPLAAIGPPTAADAAATADPALAPVIAPAPAAAAVTAKTPSWLASRPTPRAPATGKSSLPSMGRMLGLLLVVGSLGGAALYLKRRGPADGARALTPQQRLSVLSSTRIGPKAHAVVISVAGRQMLLGVTDASVKRLAFIDELEDEDDAREREPARRDMTSRHAHSRGAAIAVRNVTPEPAAKAGSFSDILRTAFKKREPVREADAASILAAETQDIVGGKPVTPSPNANVRMLDVEGQAQGLIRRLSGPRA